jgi:hypothetical protein
MRQGELDSTESCTPYAPRAMYRCGSYTSSRNLRSPSNATHGRVLGTGMPFQMIPGENRLKRNIVAKKRSSASKKQTGLSLR